MYVWQYLDDYITISATGSGECALNYQLVLHMCGKLGVPLAPDKCEGPTTCITFLGMELGTIVLEVDLPPEKMQNLRRLIIVCA